MKRIISVLLTAALLTAALSLCAASASAEEKTASQSEEGNEAKIRFKPALEFFGDVDELFVYITDENGEAFFEKGSAEWKMEKAEPQGAEISWDYDINGHGITLAPDEKYSLSFSAFDGKVYTEELEFTTEDLNRVVCTDGSASESSDGIRIYGIKWKTDSPNSTSFYFHNSTEVFKDAEEFYAYIFDKNTFDFVFDWGSDDCKMKRINDNTWYFDLSEHGAELDPDREYSLVFSPDWNSLTYALDICGETADDIAYLTGEVDVFADDGFSVAYVEWTDYDPGEDEVEWEQRDDGKVYFYEKPFSTPYFEQLYAVLSSGKDKSEFPMTNEGGGIWSFDPAENGITIGDGDKYSLYFLFDSDRYTSALDLTTKELGDMAYVSFDYEYEDEFIYTAEWVNNSQPQEEIIPGDLDGDGKVTVQDVTMLQRHIAEFTDEDGLPLIDELDERGLSIADYDGDGKVTLDDVTKMQRFIAEFE